MDKDIARKIMDDLYNERFKEKLDRKTNTLDLPENYLLLADLEDAYTEHLARATILIDYLGNEIYNDAEKYPRKVSEALDFLEDQVKHAETRKNQILDNSPDPM